MGNEQTKKQTDVQIQLNHPRINNIKIINDSKKRYMQALITAEFYHYDIWKNNLQKTKINSDFVLLPNNHKFQTNAFCGTAGSVKIDYDNYPYLLIQQIENRKAKKKRFDQTELWLLLYCLIEAQKQFRIGNKSRLGDIRPQNIFINQEGGMKISNILSWPGETSNYQKFIQNQITYLAPEDVYFVKQSNLNNQQNALSQIFSIGLTVLSAATLTDYKFLYSTKSSTFNLQQFDRITNQWRLNQYYSDIFKATLCSLIQTDPQNRLSELELQPWLQIYKSQILSRNNFVITSPPKKIIHQVQIIRNLYQNVGFSTYSSQGMSSINNSQQKRVILGAPVQGQRRLIQQKRLPPVSIIPGTSTTQSIYAPIQKSYMSNYLLQGAPIISTNPVYINRVIQSQNGQISDSTYHHGWNYQGSSTIPKMNFQYSSSPERNILQMERNLEKSPQIVKEQQTNQFQISQDKRKEINQ